MIGVLAGNRAIQSPSPRFEPDREPATKRPGDFLTSARIAVEIRPPFDKRAITIDHLCHTHGDLEPFDRERWRPAELIGLRAIDVGRRQQLLPDLPVPIEHIPDGANGVAGPAIFDPAFAGAVDPDGVVVEITNDFPGIRRRSLDRGAVIGPGHRDLAQ